MLTPLTSASAITQTELTSAIVRNPLIVAPDTTVRDAITQMSGLHTVCLMSTTGDNRPEELHIEARSSCVLIAENQKLLGILTERDVVRLSTEKRSLESLPVREVMAHPVVTLQESAFTDLFFAITLLKQHRIRHLPILNDQDQIVGLLTHETLRQTSRPADLLRLRLVAEVMIANVVSLSPDSPILRIAELMAKHRVSSVVIVQEQNSLLIPIGFVTERDLVQCQALNLDLETCMADQVMNIVIFPVRKDDSLWAVQRMMERHLIRHLVVTGGEGETAGNYHPDQYFTSPQPPGIIQISRSFRTESITVRSGENRTFKPSESGIRTSSPRKNGYPQGQSQTRGVNHHNCHSNSFLPEFARDSEDNGGTNPISPQL
ncbi:MAG: CBS domain-containing protein [Planktothrix sp. GU0601_MAG3]|nr:MAG: CBS domain-containing protein [Planktothrix sp. GU0601_MAG3]